MDKKDREIENEKRLLKEEIERVQEEMAAALNNFSDVVDPALVEYYTYCYKANQIKHGYLLRRLKSLYYESKEKNKLSAKTSKHINRA
mgnify:FL=1